MTEFLHSPKIKLEHLAWRSSDKRVRQSKERQRLQYDLAGRVHAPGWREVNVLHVDLGASTDIGSTRREELDRVLRSVALGEVCIVLSREAARLFRTGKGWCGLLGIGPFFETRSGDNRLVLGIQGTYNVVELKNLRQQLYEGQAARARRGEPFRRVGSVHVAAGGCVFQPDRRIYEAIQLALAKYGFVRQAVQWFRDHDVELPAGPIHATRLGWKVRLQSLIRNAQRNPLCSESYLRARHPVEAHNAKITHAEIFYPFHLFHTSILGVIEKLKRRDNAVSAINPIRRRLQVPLWMRLPDSTEMKIAEQPHLSGGALLSLTSLLSPLLDTGGKTHDNLAQTVFNACEGGHRAATTTSGPGRNGGASGAHRRNGSNRTGRSHGPHYGGGSSSGRRKTQ